MPATEKCLGPSLDEADTFDQLKGPTACSLVTGASSTLLMDLAQVVVLPKDKVYHIVPVQDGYVEVKIDHVHHNAEPVALHIPMDDAEIFIWGMPVTPRSNGRKLLFASRPLVSPLHHLQDDPQLLVKKSGHAPQRLNL